jgi:formamidopyrimidine-DNA glycosylase
MMQGVYTDWKDIQGWMKFTTEETFYYSSNRKSKSSNTAADETTAAAASEAEDASSSSSTTPKKKAKGKAKQTKADEETPWPPKYAKFILSTDDATVSAAFVDARRLARIRLIDVPADSMRTTSPLKENGPDPIIDSAILTVDWLKARLAKKRVPIKAYLLEQSNISGIGNWVGDEILYHAKVHPEQYSHTLSSAQVEQLHESIMYVCELAVRELSDSKKFPEEWLFKHRWNKGKKGESVNVLPNGEKIEYVTVGGRTSAIVPSVQKKVCLLWLLSI